MSLEEFDSTYHGQVLIWDVIVDSDPGGVVFPHMEGRARRCAIEND